MWLPKCPATLIDNTIDQHTLFVVQAWHELLSPTTSDSYQAKTLDLPLLLQDLLHVAHVASEDDRWMSYLPMLAAELERARLGEQRLLTSHPKLSFAIENVEHDARQKKDVLGLIDKLALAISLYGDPADRLLADAIEMAPASTTGKKLPRGALMTRLSSLATHVQYRGCGEDSSALINETMLAQTPADVIQTVTAVLRTKEAVWKCALAVSGKASEVVSTANAASFRPHGIGDYVGMGKEADTWVRLYKKHTQIVLDVTAQSSRHAAVIAMNKLSAVLDVHNLYVNSPTFLVHDKVLTYPKVGQPQIIRVTPSDHFGLLPRTGHRALAKKRIRTIGSRLDGRLANALESHRLAISATDPRTAIINLWTALETLCGSSGPASIGARVATKISPIMAWRRVNRIATHLALEIHATRNFENTWVDTNILPRSKPHKISVDDVLSALTGPEDNAKIVGIFSMVGDSPLLRHRIFESWKLFHDPTEICSALQRCKETVEWQIFRIYRSRNLLVHRGEPSHLNWRILQNAQYYVSTALGRVMHDLSEFENWSVDTSLHSHAQHYRYLTKALANNPKSLTHFDFLSDHSDCGDELIWP
jgi:hypothetical protein